MDNEVPLDAIGREIKARVDAGDKAFARAEDQYRSAGLYLIQAKRRIEQTREMTWPDFLAQYCRLGKSRANELIAIADGRTTLAATRAKTRKRVGAYRRRMGSRPLRNGGLSQDDPDRGEIARRQNFMYRADQAVRLAEVDDMSDIEFSQDLYNAARQARDAWKGLVEKMEARRKAARHMPPVADINANDNPRLAA
jgi:hypothetical protein